jgi:hypothetical protein
MICVAFILSHATTHFIQTTRHIHSIALQYLSNRTLYPFNRTQTFFQTLLYPFKNDQIPGAKLRVPGKCLFWMVCVAFILSHATTRFIQTTRYIHSIALEFL